MNEARPLTRSPATQQETLPWQPASLASTFEQAALRETSTECKAMPRRNSSGDVKGHVKGPEEPKLLSMSFTN